MVCVAAMAGDMRWSGGPRVILFLLVAWWGCCPPAEASSCIKLDSPSGTVDASNAISYAKFAEVADAIIADGDVNKMVNVVVKKGATAEGRNIYMFVVKPYLKFCPEVLRQPKERYYFESGLEGNDFNSVNMMIQFVCQIVENCETNNACELDYYIVPMANPDGYEYARTTSKTWIKNRQPNSASASCPGVRMNHNFPPSWGEHASSDPCAATYQGASSGSAKEVAALMKLRSCIKNFTMAITVLTDAEQDRMHWPKAADLTPVANVEDYKKMAGWFDNSGSVDTRQYSLWRQDSGTSMDYLHQTHPDTFSFTLRVKRASAARKAHRFTGNLLKITEGLMKMVTLNNSRAPIILNTTSSTKPVPVLNLATLKAGECPGYDAIVNHLEKLEKTSPKVHLVKQLLSGGQYVYMVIVQPYIDPNVKNPKPRAVRNSYWIEGGLEANACDSVTSLLGAIDTLVYRTPKALKPNRFYVLPLLNPEGYTYGRVMNSTAWSKNREKVGNTLCRGVSINNNFPPQSRFEIRASNDTCAEDFRGEYAGSSGEAKAAMLLKYSAGSVSASLTLISSKADGVPHILYPVAYHPLDIPEVANYTRVAEAFGKEMSQKTTADSYGRWSASSGTSMDYSYNTNKGAYALTYAMPRGERRGALEQGREVAKGVFGLIKTVEAMG